MPLHVFRFAQNLSHGRVSLPESQAASPGSKCSAVRLPSFIEENGIIRAIDIFTISNWFEDEVILVYGMHLA